MKNQFILINLLPYREKLKKEKLKKFGMLVASFSVVSIGLLTLGHLFISFEMSNQKVRNEYVNKVNTDLDKQIKEISNLKEEIKVTLEKRRVVEALQVNRSDLVNILNEISNQLGDGITLKTVKQTGKLLTITGKTQSNSKVSRYMNNLEKNNIFTNANLIEIKLSNPPPSTNNPNTQGNKKGVIEDTSVYSDFIITVEINKEDLLKEIEKEKTKSTNTKK